MGFKPMQIIFKFKESHQLKKPNPKRSALWPCLPQRIFSSASLLCRLKLFHTIPPLLGGIVPVASLPRREVGENPTRTRRCDGQINDWPTSHCSGDSEWEGGQPKVQSQKTGPERGADTPCVAPTVFVLANRDGRAGFYNLRAFPIRTRAARSLELRRHWS